LAVNPAYCATVGYSAAQLREQGLTFLVHPDDRGAAEGVLADLVAGRVERSVLETRLVRSDGRSLWTVVTSSLLRDDRGRPLQALGQLEDVTERREAQERLAHQALHDGLTGLPNRLLLMDRLSNALARGARSPGSVALCYLDLDHLKRVNDSLGHAAGDRLIVEAARRITQTVRPGDTVARLGGDELVVLLEGIARAEDGREAAQRIVEALGRPLRVGGVEVHPSASVGLAFSREGSTTAAAMLAEADAALYRAKKGGRARHEVYDESLRVAAAERSETARALREAVEGGKLRAAYQPVVDTGSGRLVGAEAILRWEHPEHGLTEVGRIRSVTEPAGLGGAVLETLLGQATRALARWRAVRPELSLTVGLALADLVDAGLEVRLRGAVGEAGLASDALWLQVSESTYREADGSGATSLADLRRAGFMVALEDFGVGPSSLVSAKTLAVDALQVGAGLVAGLGLVRLDGALVRAVIGLAAVMGVGCVARGVQTEAQRQLLVDLGCPQAQGPLFWPMLDEAEMTALVLAGRPPAGQPLGYAVAPLRRRRGPIV
ncbi:MAG: putative bifunctional diguanylate cyclase/phosphodiesterase, partial [Acidimicrobiales bacterium]